MAKILCFRGEDTRKKFTDHLYAGLERKGISTFKDDEQLNRGKLIGPELLKAIEESRFVVVILSSDYSSSRWCLIELAKIVDCMKKTGLRVLPVFHYVDPSDVRNQGGLIYAKAFKKHEKRFKDSNKEDVRKWKAALTQVASIAGWDLRDRHESKVIQEIVGTISSELNRKFSKTISKNIVGIDSRVEKMLDYYLCEELRGVRFIGICGMAGMGETTLAQEIYRRISGNFEASSFIANVKEKTKSQGLVSLRKHLLSKILMQGEIRISNVSEGISVIGNRLCNKRVLIVLDDVDGDEQLEALAGKHDWFGLGSRIILTSRDSHLLIGHGMDALYNCKGLNDDEALELFSWRAFEKPYPIEDCVELSEDFVNYAKGSPLTITIFGSMLFGEGIDKWKIILAIVKYYPDFCILDMLQKGLGRLMNIEKEILDNVCLFEGKNNCARAILESFGYYPNNDVVIDNYLVAIDARGRIRMHGLLQLMGQEIVCLESPKEPGRSSRLWRLESPKEPGRRSRLWRYKDVYHGTEFIGGIVLKGPVHKKTEKVSRDCGKYVMFMET
ncbi:TMV resistance protein N-like [Quercus lobata]|uniref:TMV resistance protein N-like n=1 Tax=Quercus lobata TaxID=97700 RepID=UPI001243EC71|nr:TMV resistance protein N-like [Quercus lobata]